MGRDRNVEPESERITISEGDYLDVKKRLNHGEHDDYLARISPFQVPGEPMRMERRQIRSSMVLAYLIGWSLTHKGKPIPFSPDLPEDVRLSTLNSLDKDTFKEIHDAIDKHDDKSNAEAAAKNTTGGGANVLKVISPSPSDATGPTTTSDPLTEASTTSS